MTAWNGQAISAYALASRILPAQQPQPQPCFPVEGCAPEVYLAAAVAAAEFVKQQLWDESKGRLRRAFCKAPSAVEGGRSNFCTSFFNNCYPNVWLRALQPAPSRDIRCTLLTLPVIGKNPGV